MLQRRVVGRKGIKNRYTTKCDTLYERENQGNTEHRGEGLTLLKSLKVFLRKNLRSMWRNEGSWDNGGGMRRKVGNEKPKRSLQSEYPRQRPEQDNCCSERTWPSSVWEERWLQLYGGQVINNCFSWSLFQRHGEPLRFFSRKVIWFLGIILAATQDVHFLWRRNRTCSLEGDSPSVAILGEKQWTAV